ncbi:hypothetical protein EV701_10525 [Chthoniobacter flavus]|nr:hypothetical protein EV701_10525 [Chthoniobacter flavus]
MKFHCQCDHVISDSTTDIPYKAYSWPDQSRDAVFAAIERLMERPVPADILQQDALVWPIVIPKGQRTMYQCPECGRLHIKSDDGHYWCFKPEFDGTPKTLFQASRSTEKAP